MAAEQAKRDRDTAVIEMDDSIRQVERYLSSHNPSIRILKQKINKVDDKKECAKHRHFEYCHKAKVPVDDEDEKLFITNILDTATDCMDRALLFFEEKEIEKDTQEKLNSEAVIEEERKKERSARISRLMSELGSENNFAYESNGENGYDYR